MKIHSVSETKTEIFLKANPASNKSFFISISYATVRKRKWYTQLWHATSTQRVRKSIFKIKILKKLHEISERWRAERDRLMTWVITQKRLLCCGKLKTGLALTFLKKCGCLTWQHGFYYVSLIHSIALFQPKTPKLCLASAVATLSLICSVIVNRYVRKLNLKSTSHCYNLL